MDIAYTVAQHPLIEDIDEDLIDTQSRGACQHCTHVNYVAIPTAGHGSREPLVSLSSFLLSNGREMRTKPKKGQGHRVCNC